MKNIARYDNGQIQNKIEYTPEGYLKGSAIVTRTGIFKYQNADGSIRNELRHPDDIWKLDSIKSMEMLPITNNHPQERIVNTENFKKLSIGYTGETIRKQNDNISTNIIITDKDGIEAVQNGRRQLSLGYLVDLVDEQGEYQGQRYDARQTNIRYNHLAIVDKARAGDQAKINLDSNDAIEILNKEDVMSKKMIKIDNEEIMVGETEANYIGKLEEDFKNLTEEKMRVENELEAIEKKLEEALAERDMLKDSSKEMTMEPKMDSAKFNEIVNQRVKLLQVANDSLSSDVMKTIDKLSNFEIKKEVVKARKKSVDVNGKSETYIDCMYDLISCESFAKPVNLDNVQRTTVTDMSSDPIAKARNAMIERSKTFINSKN